MLLPVAILCLPETGPKVPNVTVGGELMEWLNTHFVQPSTQEGDELNGLEQPWEDPAFWVFWPYLTGTVLRGLSKASTLHAGKSPLYLPAESCVTVVELCPSIGGGNAPAVIVLPPPTMN